jgi:Raf kinase inhibitor-like YbhB/YbcL family protein
MKFYSKDFDDYGYLDAAYTKEGKNISPSFEISDVPESAKSLVLTVHDIDSPGDKHWTHWMVWAIPPKTSSISSETTPKTAVQGVNDFGDVGYGGPLPTVGSGDHRYIFSLYAIDIQPTFPESISRDQLLKEVAGHIVSQSMWVGIYRRD